MDGRSGLNAPFIAWFIAISSLPFTLFAAGILIYTSGGVVIITFKTLGQNEFLSFFARPERKTFSLHSPGPKKPVEKFDKTEQLLPSLLSFEIATRNCSQIVVSREESYFTA